MADVQETFERMKKAIFAPDVDTVIAELTNVQLDSLRKKNERDVMLSMEPLVGFFIVANGIIIGVQTDPHLNNWFGWQIFEVFFVCVFSIEALLKMMHAGIREHFWGHDFTWNIFDMTIILFAIFDMIFSNVFPQFHLSQLIILRLIRLTRLARLVRIFRLKSMKELTLMVKGLFGGMLTLLWAIIILLFVIYISSVAMTTLVNTTDLDSVSLDFRDEVYPISHYLHWSMLTIFRCFIGDCSSRLGTPLIYMLIDVYGAPIALLWIAVMFLVIFGLFNLVMAIYLENTLASAKVQEESAKHVEKEALRVAKNTRKLCSRFCAAQREANEGTVLSGHNIRSVLGRVSS